MADAITWRTPDSCDCETLDVATTRKPKKTGDNCEQH